MYFCLGKGVRVHLFHFYLHFLHWNEYLFLFFFTLYVYVHTCIHIYMCVHAIYAGSQFVTMPQKWFILEFIIWYERAYLHLKFLIDYLVSIQHMYFEEYQRTGFIFLHFLFFKDVMKCLFIIQKDTCTPMFIAALFTIARS